MKILLATLHAKYIHASLALPYLAASIHDLDGIDTIVREYTVNEPPSRILRSIMDIDADVVAFSCYIWNITATGRIASDLKKLRPDTMIVVGGPEVSHTAEEVLRENSAFDAVIRGEGETTWRELVCLLKREGTFPGRSQGMPAGLTFRMGEKSIATPTREPIRDLDEIPSPFALGMVDTGKPLIYYETSRGCPYDCAFCLSSLEQGVRSFSMERIRRDLQLLMDGNVAVIKFVDRTFNYDGNRANEIWEFIIAHNRRSRFHFEIAADLLTDRNLQTLRKVPPGMFRFEIGVQATGTETLERVGRRHDTEQLLAKATRLATETGITVHLDLVAGLPGEDLKGFHRSLQMLFQVSPHHIQVEPLKVLKGSPMADIALRERYAFSSTPPYKILSTPDLSFRDIGRIEDTSRLLDLFYNSNRFIRSLAEIAQCMPLSVFFDEMTRFMPDERESGNLSLAGLFTLLWRFTETRFLFPDRETVRDAICYDFCLMEYPSGGTLPPFFPSVKRRPHSISRNRLDDLSKRQNLIHGSRIRTFAADFMKDYTQSTPPQRAVTLVFIYITSPGQGLEVKVMPLDQIADRSDTSSRR
jgi:anaerobic magnesium-protoporphyrin IX monomethyl ester cyclase